jgi:uncharacterized protein YjbI with pentapeptide repeats
MTVFTREEVEDIVSKLEGADLSGVYLGQANLSDANLTGTNLLAAYYDADTKWPADFDPEAAGARLVD